MLCFGIYGLHNFRVLRVPMVELVGIIDTILLWMHLFDDCSIPSTFLHFMNQLLAKHEPDESSLRDEFQRGKTKRKNRF